MLILSPSCGNKTRIDNIQNQWSGLNPTSIPHQVRLKEFEKGNLITNPSFELGKYYKVDSTKLSFSLPGWKKLGENVTWTNTENSLEFDEEEASIGIRAIKITRTRSDETDVQGEGVITDFIKVLPGNYQLSFDIRLEHIRSNLYRLGTRVFDAVNIRVYCYDKNKVMIKNVAIHPLNNSEIDNSFKGYGFTGQEEIEKFGWSRVFGRTGNFPFEEGNIPENTRYVKVFAGLKGEGEMWIDRIDFRYTSKNFTLLEQLEPYFDTTLERSHYLIPQPRKVSAYKGIPFIRLKSDNNKEIKPGILLPLNPDRQTMDFIRYFNQKIPDDSLKSNFKFTIFNRSDDQINERQSILFSIGINQLSRQFADQLPFEEIKDIPQAYFMQRLDLLDNVIFIGYTDMEGLFHALHTLFQLIDIKENIYHHYNIIDFPDYYSRGLVFNLEGGKKLAGEWAQGIDYLVANGFNTWIPRLPEQQLGITSINQAAKDWISFSFNKKSFPFLKKGISLEELKIPSLGEKLNNAYLTKSENQISSLTLELYDELKGIGSKNIDIILFSDKTLWESIHSSEKGIIDLSHDDFNKFLLYRTSFAENYSKLDFKDFPNSYLIPYFQNIRISGNIYSDLYTKALADSTLNQWFNKILWNGPVQGSTQVDPMDMYGFQSSSPVSYIDYSLSYRSESSYYGNYYSLFPGKALTGIIFKPFDTQITGIQPEVFQNEILIGANDLTDINQIRLATAADYLWNSSHYNPVNSLWRVLNSKYGKEVAKELVIFNDLYFKLLSVSLEMEMSGYNQRIEKQGEELVIQINLHWDKIKIMLNSRIEFLNELSDLKNKIISKFYNSRKNSLNVGNQDIMKK